jgi:hypothetical protein
MANPGQEFPMMIMIRTALPLMLFLFSPMAALHAAEFDILKFGATANDSSDDTTAIIAALRACSEKGGGTVLVPSGTFIVSRQGSEDPIIAIPSNITLRGEGAASILKFADKANASNFWRMLGAPKDGCRNVAICDLHLDGSNTFPKYEKGRTPEQNHGIFMSTQSGVIENVTIRNVLVENFCGDCVAIGRGCRSITVRDVSVRNFIRQGIQMAGDEGARDYLVTGCKDLEHSIEPGGSTIHVEHARGLKNVIITSNHCRRSILAGGVTNLVLADNIVEGRIEGNGNINAIVRGNSVTGAEGGKAHLMQFGYSDGIILKDNFITGATEGQGGIYVWGTSKYNPEPSKQVLIMGNALRIKGQPILLNGVRGGLVRDNLAEGVEPADVVKLQRCENVEVRTVTRGNNERGTEETPRK